MMQRCLLPLLLLTSVSVAADSADPRLLSQARPIPSEGYADQPYVVKTDDGAWLCVMTTGKGVEGSSGQHVVSLRSTDQGRTWAKPVDVEPAGGPEASLCRAAEGARRPHLRLLQPQHRQRPRGEATRTGASYKRVDSLGHYVFKYSDDDGRTWSAQRYDDPDARSSTSTARTRTAGKLRFFWNVGTPADPAATRRSWSLHKVGAIGRRLLRPVAKASCSAAETSSPSATRRRSLGRRCPTATSACARPPGGGRVAEEQSLVVLSDGSLYCVYRTIDGYPACAYSRDGGHTWTRPAYRQLLPDGRPDEASRAPPTSSGAARNGKYPLLVPQPRRPVHRRAARPAGTAAYEDRNPAWLCGGVEADTPEGA